MTMKRTQKTRVQGYREIVDVRSYLPSILQSCPTLAFQLAGGALCESQIPRALSTASVCGGELQSHNSYGHVHKRRWQRNCSTEAAREGRSLHRPLAWGGPMRDFSALNGRLHDARGATPLTLWPPDVFRSGIDNAADGGTGWTRQWENRRRL